MDAETRHLIDSLSTKEIQQLRRDLDTLCLGQRKTELPRLIDSIKRHRKEEIAAKLRNIPKN